MKIKPTDPLAARATSAKVRPPDFWATALQKEARGHAHEEPQATLFEPAAAAPAPGAHVVLRLPYPPSANNLYGVRAIKVRGKWIGQPYKTKEHEDYVGAVHHAIRLAQLRDRSLDVLPLAGVLRLVIRLYRPRKIGDWDNPLKALNDSLNGVAWGDDAQTDEAHVYRLDDKHDPRVEVEIDAVTR